MMQIRPRTPCVVLPSQRARNQHRHHREFDRTLPAKGFPPDKGFREGGGMLKIRLRKDTVGSNPTPSANPTKALVDSIKYVHKSPVCIFLSEIVNLSRAQLLCILYRSRHSVSERRSSHRGERIRSSKAPWAFAMP